MRTLMMRYGVMVIAALGVGLGGCRSRPLDYHVQVRNETSGVVQVMVLRDSDERIVPLIRQTVYPKDRGELSLPLRPARERLTLQVDAPNNPATPARMPLNHGFSHVVVTREGDEGPIHLELLKGR